MAKMQNVLVIPVAVVVLAACSSSPPSIDPESPAASYVRTGEWGEGNAALLEGTLRLENDCLVVESEIGRVVPIFPTDLEWDEDEGALSGLGHDVVVDEPVSLGGGEAPPAIADHLPEYCAGAELFQVHSIEGHR